MTRYRAPEAAGRAPAWLVTGRDTPDERRYPFHDRLEIGRDDGLAVPAPPAGALLIADGTVSRAHCVITRRPDGRCFIRDTSRNGTRLDGRRLVPNIDTELRPGQTISLGENSEFLFLCDPGDSSATSRVTDSTPGTIAIPSCVVATVLVGDIRDYTVLVRERPGAQVQQSVNRVFDVLAAAVTERGGTVKEYQGDAIVAFWEGKSGDQAAAACRAALELNAIAQKLAADRSVWAVDDFPLGLDWALASGPVVIQGFGSTQVTGLSMIGEAVVLAFRLEKFATAATGPIVACRATQEMAAGAFRFRDLGEMKAKGFDRADRVFALEGVVEPVPAPETVA